MATATRNSWWTTLMIQLSCCCCFCCGCLNCCPASDGAIPELTRKHTTEYPESTPQMHPGYPKPIRNTKIPDIVVRAIEPSEWDIDGGPQAIIIIVEGAPRRIPYSPRFGDQWAAQPPQPPAGPIVCHIPPVSKAGSVEVSFWRQEGGGPRNRVLSTPYEFKYRDRSTRKVLQLGLKTIFDRLSHSGYDSSQVGPRKPQQPRLAAELEETDQIAVAIMESYGRHTNSPPPAPSGSKRQDLKPRTGQPPPKHEMKALVPGIVLDALKSFVWTNKHDLLAHTTGHGQNFLHICVTGNYRELLRFFLERGCGDPEKQERKDDFGRRARDLARVMERREIELLLFTTRTEVPPDPRHSYQQINATVELARMWLDLRRVPSRFQEVIWELQPDGRWRKFDEPRFERNDDRVNVLKGYMATKEDKTPTRPSKIRTHPHPSHSNSAPSGPTKHSRFPPLKGLVYTLASRQ